MNRDNYPVNEPIFPHWNNLGARLEAEADALWENDGMTRAKWVYRQGVKTSLVSKDWSRWKHMEFRYATDIDAKKRTCEWCYDKLDSMGKQKAEIDKEIIPFRKNDIVIREQFSNQDFRTLHVECAREKLNAVKKDFDKALENMDEMMYIAHGNLTNSRYDRQNR